MNLNSLSLIFPPLISIFILMNGLGMFVTLIPIKLVSQGVSSWGIGAVTSAYYLGMALGSFNNSSIILRVGHIRAFAAFASIVTTSVLLNSIFESLWSWILLRAVGGYCLAGLYIVIESWIIKTGEADTRGIYLSLYMIAIYGASASGQFLLNISDTNGIYPFIIVSILTSLSIFPLAISKIGNPVIEEPSTLGLFQLFKLSPSGLISCICAGIVFSSVSSFTPIYIKSSFIDPAQISFIMFIIMFGGMALQYPVGYISDRLDRRKVLMAACITIVTASILTFLISNDNIYTIYLIMFLFGGATFALYPLSISITCDNVDSKDILEATQGLMLFYGVGAVLGPLMAPFFIDTFGNSGIFIFLTTICTPLCLYLGARVVMYKTSGDYQSFVPLPNTTPIASELNPNLDEKNE